MSDHLRIRSKKAMDYIESFTIDSKTYTIQTEDLGMKTSTISTRIYHQGQIVYSEDSDYTHLIGLEDFEARRLALMEKQHKAAIDAFSTGLTVRRKSRLEYAEELSLLMTAAERTAALACVEEALRHYPSDLSFLSHWGLLVALVRKRQGEGAKICEEAIKNLKMVRNDDMKDSYPLFYLNLGKVYAESGRKRAAFKAISEGLRHDPDHAALKAEEMAMGKRAAPVITFLEREHPINKYLGRLRHSLRKK